MTRIIVTGATGFIGRPVLRRLQAAGADAAPYRGRIGDAVRLRAELRGATTVIHLAGAESRGRTRLLRQVDVYGTRSLVEAAHYCGVRHVILISRLNADPNAYFPLLRAKGEAERTVRRSGLPYTIVRCATCFGAADRFTNTLTALAAWSWPYVWIPGDGSSVWQPLWVEDAARCLTQLALDNRPQNEVLPLGGTERFHHVELMLMLLKAANIQRRPVRAKTQFLRTINILFFRWWRVPPVNRFLLDSFSLAEIAELDGIERRFGFRPQRLHYHLNHLQGGAIRWRLFVP